MSKKYEIADLPVTGGAAGASQAIGRTDGRIEFEIEFSEDNQLTTTASELITLGSGYVVTGMYAEVLGELDVAVSLFADSNSTAILTSGTAEGAKVGKACATYAVEKVTAKSASTTASGTLRIVLLTSDVG